MKNACINAEGSQNPEKLPTPVACKEPGGKSLMNGFALVFTCAYTLVISLVAVHHVVWRDEVRALEIAVAPSSLNGLTLNLKNEGHPLLWYLLLRAAFLLAGTTAVLKIVSVGAASVGTYLFARYAPYSIFEVVLWSLGLLPLYEYSVMCREYVLILPLVFAYCALFRTRQKHPIAAGALLALLANTDVYGTVLALAFLGAEACLWLTRGNPRTEIKAFLTTAVTTLAGVVMAVAVMMPDKSNTSTSMLKLQPEQVLHDLIGALYSHGGVAGQLISLHWSLPVSLIVAVWYLFLGRRIHLSLFVFMAVIGSELVSRLIYGALLRHQGAVLVALVAAHWMATAGERNGEPAAYENANLRRLTSLLAHSVLIFLLAIQAYKGIRAVHQDYGKDASSAKQLAEYIQGRVNLKSAVLIVEPDYLADTIPYYLTNRIYFPRLGCFAQYADFTTRTRSSLSLGELLKAGGDIHSRENLPVLILLGCDLTKPGTASFGENRFLTFDENQLNVWSHSTLLLKIFNQGYKGNENYTLYQLVDDPSK